MKTVVKYGDGSTRTYYGISRRYVNRDSEKEYLNDYRPMSKRNMKNRDLVIIWYSDNQHEFWAIEANCLNTLLRYLKDSGEDQILPMTLYKAS